ncbi:MAG: helix-turn-helix transcriptional regulator [Nitrospinae bacterium]|nr:helix-turn-helix transcriptional regulator [Nitrospinota bacterium]
MKGKNIVGNNIRKLRINACFTQEELALRSGLSQGYINQLESGKRRFTQKTLELIAEALSIPITELFREGEIPKTPVIAKKNGNYGKKRPDKKEFLCLLKELPDHIAEHYLILLRLERELWASTLPKKTSS